MFMYQWVASEGKALLETGFVLLFSLLQKNTLWAMSQCSER